MVRKVHSKVNDIEKFSLKITRWIGTPWSIIVHTFLFAFIFSLKFFGVPVDQILLILTTAVSLEAIYLAIFIQMTVNRNTAALEAVEEDIEDIQEEVEDLGEDVEDISEDIDEINKKKRKGVKKAVKRSGIGQVEDTVINFAKKVKAIGTRDI